MSAKIKLIPISRDDCRDRLCHMNITVDDDVVPQEEYYGERQQITLMLCTAARDVIDVDNVKLDEVDELGYVVYGSINEEGGFSAAVTLGRNTQTRIRSSVVSRVLCDVILRKNDDDDAEGLLTMRKPGEGRHVYHNGHIVNAHVGENVPIHDRSIIALCGPTSFAFEVQMLQAAIDCTSSDDENVDDGPALEDEVEGDTNGVVDKYSSSDDENYDDDDGGDREGED